MASPGPANESAGSYILIRPKCITILYCNLTLFIDIFHFKVLFLCCVGVFYTVCNFPVPKQVSLSEDAKVEYRTSRTHEIQVGGEVNNGAVLNLRLLTSPGPAHRYK